MAYGQQDRTPWLLALLVFFALLFIWRSLSSYYWEDETTYGHGINTQCSGSGGDDEDEYGHRRPLLEGLKPASRKGKQRTTVTPPKTTTNTVTAPVTTEIKTETKTINPGSAVPVPKPAVKRSSSLTLNKASRVKQTAKPKAKPREQDSAKTKMMKQKNAMRSITTNSIR